jgi:threonine/homoserine/homoserine lactone efflux protein
VTKYLLFGATYAFAAAAQPGPFQAYLVSQTLSIGWRRTLPAVLAPLISDAPIALAVLVILARLPLALQQGLRVAGGMFLLYLAYRAFETWKRYDEAREVSPQSSRRTLLDATVVNFLNPNAWIGWSLIMGPLLLEAWREAPAQAVALIVTFYTILVAGTAAIVVLVAGATRFGPRVARSLVGISVVALAAFGGYQLWSGATALLGSWF